MRTLRIPPPVCPRAADRRRRCRHLRLELLETRSLLSGLPPIALDDSYTTNQGQSLTTIGGAGTTIIPGGSDWAWLLPASDPASVDADFNATWMLPATQFAAQYNGPAFAAPAAAPLGYGDAYIRTDLAKPSLGSRGAAYFRRDFTRNSALSGVLIDVIRDDGAIVYLDGVEIGRSNMNEGADTWGLTGIGSATGVEGQFYAVKPLSTTSIGVGAHTLAVSLHNESLNSADLGFDVRLRTATGILGMLGNDSDPENDSLTAQKQTNPQHGQLTSFGTNGSFTYVPDAGFRGPTDSFTYVAKDGTGTSAVATVTIEIVPNNFSPVAVDDTYTVPQGQALSTVAGGTTLVAAGSSWRYLDDGSNQGTAWQLPSFADSTWKVGNAQLGYGEGDEATVVSFGPNASNKYLTTYFRQTFQVASLANYTSLSALVKRDDGIAVYLNGVEILRDNLDPAATSTTTATLNVPDDGHDFLGFHNLPIAALQAGTNTVAVEIHQASATSSDVSFDLQLIGVGGVLGLAANDGDREGNPLAASADTLPVAGALSLAANGTFTYTPNPGFVGTDTFTYHQFDGTSSSPPATVTIQVPPSSGVPSIAIADVSIGEGNSGTTNAAFAVTLSSASSQPVTVAYSTADGSATAGSDYLAAAGTLTFAPGVTSQFVNVAIEGDTAVEPDETFLVNLSAPSQATLADGQATGTIVNDDSLQTTFHVTTTLDSGPGSLRQAVLDANANAGIPHTIVFAIAGAGPHEVGLATALPALADPVSVDVPTAMEVRVGTLSSYSFAPFAALTKIGRGTLVLAGNQSYSAGATLTVAAGAVRLDSDAGGNLHVVVQSAVHFGSSQHLAGLSLAGGAAAVLDAHGGHVLATPSLALAAASSLDLADNDLVVRATPATRLAVLADVTTHLASGVAGLAWTGPGIASSAAASDPAMLTALGVMLNDDGFGQPFHAVFSGEAVDENCILVKYTYYGDADLSGLVDGTDYALADNGFNSALTGWFNGDFDYTGTVDGTDYALIDNAFNSQTGPLAAHEPLAVGPAPRASAGRRSDATNGPPPDLAILARAGEVGDLLDVLALDGEILNAIAGASSARRRQR